MVSASLIIQVTNHDLIIKPVQRWKKLSTVTEGLSLKLKPMPYTNVTIVKRTINSAKHEMYLLTVAKSPPLVLTIYAKIRVTTAKLNHSHALLKNDSKI